MTIVTPQAVLTVIDDTEKILRERGRTKSIFYDEKTDSFCLRGAIYEAVKPGIMTSERMGRVASSLTMDEADLCGGVYKALHEALQEQRKDGTSTFRGNMRSIGLFTYNDAAETSDEDVFDLLQKGRAIVQKQIS